jgi:hypothetical protein
MHPDHNSFDFSVRRFAAVLAPVFVVVALFASAARAQYSTDMRLGVGLAVTGNMPIGDFREVAGFGIGGLGGVELGAYPGLALTARSGYIKFMEKDDLTTTMIPIMGGAKITVPSTSIYFAGELGSVITKVEDAGSDLIDRGDESTNLGWSAGIGSAVGPLDLRLSYNVWDAGNMKQSTTLGLSLGLTVWSL